MLVWNNAGMNAHINAIANPVVQAQQPHNAAKLIHELDILSGYAAYSGDVYFFKIDKTPAAQTRENRCFVRSINAIYIKRGICLSKAEFLGISQNLFK